MSSWGSHVVISTSIALGPGSWLCETAGVHAFLRSRLVEMMDGDRANVLVDWRFGETCERCLTRVLWLCGAGVEFKHVGERSRHAREFVGELGRVAYTTPAHIASVIQELP